MSVVLELNVARFNIMNVTPDPLAGFPMTGEARKSVPCASDQRLLFLMVTWRAKPDVTRRKKTQPDSESWDCDFRTLAQGREPTRVLKPALRSKPASLERLAPGTSCVYSNEGQTPTSSNRRIRGCQESKWLFTRPLAAPFKVVLDENVAPFVARRGSISLLHGDP